MQLKLSAAVLLASLGWAAPGTGQVQRMTDEQQAWFNCVVSTEWCVANSIEKATQQKRAVAMVAAAKPLIISGRASRVTLQVACSKDQPITMLHTAREIAQNEISLHYRVEPSGRTGDLVGKNASAGHFFEFASQEFLKDLAGAEKAAFEANFSSQKEASVLEFNVSGTNTALKRLKCFH